MELAVPAIAEVDLDRVLKALADPQRRRVVTELVAGADEERACSSFDLPLAKSTRTHHWRTLREAGLVTQRDAGNGTFVRLRRAEFEERFPGLLSAVAALAEPRENALHPLLRGRFSPMQFDVGHSLTDGDVDLLLEAARWAPSAGNSQPWSFAVGRRGEPSHASFVARLAASSRRWAPDASALIVNVVHRYVEDTDWPYSEFADYDLGQAVAHLTLQAGAMGLSCRQFRAFDLDGLTADLALAPGWHVVSMTAVGRAAGGVRPERDRRTLADLASPPRSAPEDRR